MTKSNAKDSSNLCKKDIADPKEIRQLGEVSYRFADNFVKRLRFLLSHASVLFVRELAQKLEDLSLMRMVSEDFTFIYSNRWPTIPMFWTYKTLLLTAKQQNIPLVIGVKFLKKTNDEMLTVDEEFILLETTADGHYKITDYVDHHFDKPACVIEGVVCEDKDGKLLTKEEWRAEMSKHSIIDVILAGAADHRQYPDPQLDQHIEALQDEEFNRYRAFAKKEGFSLENPSKFFIQHVYASKVGKMLPLVQKQALASA